MDNGTIQVGIEPRCGGTIAEIMLNGENLVNNYDCTGRQIQVAQYDGNSTYDACAGCSGTWGWDPVQGGDRNGFGSIVIAQSVTRNGIYIKTQPYQWFPEDKGGGAGRPVFSDVIVEQWLSFVPGAPLAIKLHSKISHDGNDNHALAAQEFPATYINQGFDKLVYYGGVSPWTGEPVRIATAQAGIVYNAAENWAAFVDNRGSGLTVYVPGQYPYMSAFRLDDPVSGPYSNGFNYFTPFVPFEFKAGSVLEGDIYLIAGDYESARQFIYGLRSSMETADFLPPFGFLDAPASSQMLSETASVAGWVFDNGSLGRIEVLVDGTLAGTATYGYPRPDVASVFPNIDANTGYLYLLDTTNYSNGQHTITVKAFDAVGNMADLTKSVAVNFSNAAPVPPPAKLSLGDRIQITARRVSVKSAPGGIRIGRQAMNAYGTLVRGPVSQGGFTWWSIDFDRNPDGWVAENYFKKITLPAK